MTDLDQLDIMRRAITALGLGQVAPEELVAEARASSSRREEARRLLSDANVRIKDLESALRDLGVNPGGDLQGEVRAIHNRTAGDSAAAQHDLDCALRERDRAIGDARTAAARTKDLEAKIATNVAEAAARDMRIAELEQAIEGAHMVLDVAGVTWSLGNDATRLPLIKRCSLALVGNDLADPEREALKARIADLERDLTAKDTSLKTAHAALKRICEVIGAPVPCVADDAVEAVTTLFGTSEYAEARAEAAEATLKGITQALDDAGAPMLYTGTTDPNGIPIPDPERIRLLGERVRGEHAERLRLGDNVQVYRDRLAAAERALDDRDAPRFADGAPLSPAARIRAIPQ